MVSAIFPGSFDPFTLGHQEIVQRGLKVFDKIIIAVGESAIKKSFLSVDARVSLINDVFKDYNRVEVKTYKGLTVDFCKMINISFIIRGLRTAADFEYERAVGQANRSISPDIETFFVLTSTNNTFISSTIVRDIYKHGGEVAHLMPKGIDSEYIKTIEKLM